MPLFSICIPTYEMGGYGYKFLKELLVDLQKQTVQDFEIVISDQSPDYKTLEICSLFSSNLKIKYIKNFYNRGKAACNINLAMEHASGKIIKILYEDDFLLRKDTLEQIKNEFDKGAKWVVNGFTHTEDKVNFYNTRIPFYRDKILLGENSLGNPSNISLLNSEKIYMDESILYVVDCEFYYRLKEKLGPPIILPEILTCARRHPVTAVENPSFYSLKEPEVAYCLSKHKKKHEDFLY